MNPKPNDIKKILFITLSNLGDIILTTPVLEKLYDEFPQASIDVITGSSGQEIFQPHPAVKKIMIHGKRESLGERIGHIRELRRRRYDLVVDLKNSLIPYVIGARYGTRLFTKKTVMHKRAEHLSRLLGFRIDAFTDNRFLLPITDRDRIFVDGLLAGKEDTKVVVVNPGAKSHLKRWDPVKYAGLTNRLVSELGCSVFITGNEDDKDIIRRMMSNVQEPVTDLSGKTSIGELAELMRRSSLVITNDSAPLHVASAVNASTVAIFGPSDERKYGPLAEDSRVIKPPDVPCRPCEKALCAIGPDEGCIVKVEVDEVFQAAKELL